MSDEKIIDSWKKNVVPWIDAIQKHQIESRVDVTNHAIIDTINKLTPSSVIDIGCGEGWLVRELCKTGIDTLGVDAIADLIDYARKSGEGRFKNLTYEQLANNELEEHFDLAVCNFSLLGNESVSRLFQCMANILYRDGFFVIQTLHPVTACGEQEYTDGWRAGSWEGFNDAFREPAPWYFRTLESWQELFLINGFELIETLEPINPQTSAAASVLFVSQRAE